MSHHVARAAAATRVMLCSLLPNMCFRPDLTPLVAVLAPCWPRFTTSR